MQEDVCLLDFSLPLYAVLLLACLIAGGTIALIVALLIHIRQNEYAMTLRRRLDRQARQLDRAAEVEREKEMLGLRLAHAEGKLDTLAETLRCVSE